MVSKLEILGSRIIQEGELSTKLAFWRFKDRKIVFTNGCFDIIHRGHIEYLASAANEGDILIVGLNSDSSVQKLKGIERPYQDQNTRAMVLASLRFVDAVIIFDEDTPLEIIQIVKPDVLVKGGDYNLSNIVGADFVIRNKGEVKIIDYIQGQSSSIVLEKMNKLQVDV